MPSAKPPSHLTRHRTSTAVALTLLLSIGCGTATGEDPSALDPAPGAAAVEALRQPGPPARPYTESELEALAESPEVKSLNEPFAAAPPA